VRRVGLPCPTAYFLIYAGGCFVGARIARPCRTPHQLPVILRNAHPFIVVGAILRGRPCILIRRVIGFADEHSSSLHINYQRNIKFTGEGIKQRAGVETRPYIRKLSAESVFAEVQAHKFSSLTPYHRQRMRV